MIRAELLRFEELGKSDLALWRAWQSRDVALHSPFLSPEYIGTVALVHPGLRVAVLTRNGSITGFLPFQYSSRLSQVLRHAEPAGGDMTDSVGAILDPEVTVSSAELLHACGLGSFLFTHLVSGQQRAGLLAERFDPGLAIEVSPSYWKDLRGSRPHVVAEIERRRRRVRNDLGPLSLKMNAASRDASLELLFKLKTAQYRRTRVANVLAAAWKRELLRQLAAGLSPDCLGVVSTLEAGDRVLAVHFGLRRGPVLHYWFPVYDPAFARYAPGRLLLAAIIEAAPFHGISRVERGVGTAPAKRDFANAEVAYGRGLLLAGGCRSTLTRSLLAARWRWNGWTSPATGASYRPSSCSQTRVASAHPRPKHTFGFVKSLDPPC
jgi:CelD/BcsL family acetyltransferase involved in cellulose biosynthesis